MSKNMIRDARGDRVFFSVSWVLLFLALLAIAYPLWFVLIASISDPAQVSSGQVLVFPKGYQFLGYQRTLTNQRVLMGYRNSLLYMVMGTVLNVSLTLMSGYVLSVKIPGRRLMNLFVIFTMFFSGGILPFYFVVRDLGLLNTIWVMILPGAVSAYNTVIARTFMSSGIPEELYEAAELDGCSRFRFFRSIVIPLSGVLIAVLALYYAVGHWNAYFNALLFVSDKRLQPLQLVLREILIQNSLSSENITDPEMASVMEKMKQIMQYALIIVATLPMMVIYPFLQKYFIKGVLIGSIKG